MLINVLLIGLFQHLEEETPASASTFLCCSTGTIPIIFLGIPVGANPRRTSTWEPVVKSFLSRLSTWKGQFLSVGQIDTYQFNSFVIAALPFLIL
ncbi:transmembrane protein, putative [Medicago truncatula]|uniref:Transmembrane protein, putative n=1 Tax=Medicago truncatula TaxID=3880 RepID=A0A072VPK1_MEDTR|nr:transmembrane protein, putative [Medicago truncatula]